MKTSNRNSRAQKHWNFYVSRQLKNDLEPAWVHPIYRLMRDYENLRGQDKAFANETIDNLDQIVPALPTLLPNHPNVQVIGYSAAPTLGERRIIHEGWKFGTPTWVFMARALPDAKVYARGEYVVAGRAIPAEFANAVHPMRTSILGPFEPDGKLWIAYSRTDPMGYTAMTANCFGTCWGEKDLLYCMESEKK
jgi:hypothetical protein